MSGAAGLVVSCWFRLPEVGFLEFRKPQVAGSIPVAGSTLFREKTSCSPCRPGSRYDC
jgi:hypothetical protein